MAGRRIMNYLAKEVCLAGYSCMTGMTISASGFGRLATLKSFKLLLWD